MPTPQPGQKTIPIKDWQRFLRVADWWDRTIGHKQPGALRPTYGQSFLVKTPTDGIAARDGDTIYSATCTKCVEAETATPGEKTIHNTNEELVVSNVYASDIAGDAYVMTDLTSSGTRYVELDSVQLVKVSKDGGVSGGAAANCTWTYTVTTIAGATLDTTVSPEQARYSNTTYLEAAAGGRSEYALAQWVDGNWKLIWVPGEIANAGACP